MNSDTRILVSTGPEWPLDIPQQQLRPQDALSKPSPTTEKSDGTKRTSSKMSDSLKGTEPKAHVNALVEQYDADGDGKLNAKEGERQHIRTLRRPMMPWQACDRAPFGRSQQHGDRLVLVAPGLHVLEDRRNRTDRPPRPVAARKLRPRHRRGEGDERW